MGFCRVQPGSLAMMAEGASVTGDLVIRQNLRRMGLQGMFGRGKQRVFHGHVTGLAKIPHLGVGQKHGPHLDLHGPVMTVLELGPFFYRRFVFSRLCPGQLFRQHGRVLIIIGRLMLLPLLQVLFFTHNDPCGDNQKSCGHNDKQNPYAETCLNRFFCVHIEK